MSPSSSSGDASEHTPLLSGQAVDASMTHPDDDAALERDAGDNNARDDTQLRRTLRKVDFRLIPLLFVTYMLNFMDKTILSSASVFGLIDDTVRLPSRKRRCEWDLRSKMAAVLFNSIWLASNIVGCRVSSTLAISSGSIPPIFSLLGCR